MSNDAIDIGDALETLVHQFSDPWSFLRELIQNAIDAGSPEIDVRVEHQPPQAGGDGDDPGLMLVEVVDAGDGMDRQIIDTRLTRLFSSAKDGDYTKIGRFGIGFVSVFAIDPDLVCVDTGRTGEYWRVLFRKDRSFQRIALEHPTEGTTISIYKRASAGEVEAARARAREVLEYWCKHARVEVRLDGEPISRPMSLGPRARCVVEHEEEGTRLLLGYVPERRSLRGYYHGGLTLHEERDDGLPHVAFKIDSRYIEHTLTRDDVIRDDNFEKAMKIVAELARTRLVENLVDALERLASDDDPRARQEQEFLRERLLTVRTSVPDPPKSVLRRAFIPAAAPRGGRALVSLDEVRRQIKRTWCAPQPSPVTDALVGRGDLVLLYPEDSALEAVLTEHCGRAPQPAKSLCT
ncbi:MAG: ATP-binding protein, partial [Myxococcales bacterium]|nr:ATP-binding protein [Myxococcales bacterium]